MMSLEVSTDIYSDHGAALEAARAASLLAGVDAGELELVRWRQRRSWVYADSGDGEPTAIIKVEPDEHGALLSKREAQLGLVQELHEAGAPVERHLMTPARISVGRAAGETALYVATATEYLPESYDPASDDYRSYGAALAGLHRVSGHALGRVPGFRPLDVTWRTYRNLQQLCEREALPRLGEVRFDENLVLRLGKMLVGAEADIEELLERNDAQGYPPALLHTDITPFNARRSADGRGVFIDLASCCIGPWAYDFGRPLEWYRFCRSPLNVMTLLEGYACEMPWAADQQMLELGKRIAHVRYAASTATRLADMALKGAEPDPYLLHESIRRLSGETYWQSGEDYIAEQTSRLRAG